MSPLPLVLRVLGAGFPRVSGDEPQIVSNPQAILLFSPRERG